MDNGPTLTKIAKEINICVARTGTDRHGPAWTWRQEFGPVRRGHWVQSALLGLKKSLKKSLAMAWKGALGGVLLLYGCFNAHLGRLGPGPTGKTCCMAKWVKLYTNCQTGCDHIGVPSGVLAVDTIMNHHEPS